MGTLIDWPSGCKGSLLEVRLDSVHQDPTGNMKL